MLKESDSPLLVDILHGNLQTEMKFEYFFTLFFGWVCLGSVQWKTTREIKFYIKTPTEKMSHNRFQLLLSCFHFADNLQAEKENHYQKLKIFWS